MTLSIMIMMYMISNVALFAVAVVISVIASGVFVFTEDSKTQTVTDYGERYITTPADWNVQSGESGGVIPWISFDFPSEIRVGQPFEINIPYTYVKFDPEDGDVDEIKKLHGLNSSAWDPDNPGTVLFVEYPEQLKLLNDPGFNSTSSSFDPRWKLTSHSASKVIPYDITQEHNVKFVFNMTEPIKYPLEIFVLGLDVIRMHYYFNENNGVYEPSSDRNPPQFAPGAEPKPPCPDCSNYSVGAADPDYDHKRPDMESAHDVWISQGDVILEHNPQYETIEDALWDNFAHDWVEEFLEKYPQFKKQSVNLDSVFSFLLPSAYAQSQGQFVTVIGKVLIEDGDGSFLSPDAKIEACLVDENLSLNNGTYTVLKNGLTDVCKFVSSDGSFTLFGNGDDPDSINPSDRADVAVRFELTNNNLQHVLNKDNLLEHYYTNTTNNHNATIIMLSDEQINNSDDFNKAYKVYEKINDGYKHFNNLGYNDIPKVTLQYDPNGQNTSLTYSSPRIILEGSATKTIKDAPVTILHEFGHHIQKNAYAKKSSTTPACTANELPHGSNTITSDRCAWSEGWATFVGLWVEDTHVHTSFVNSHNLNFEKATINGNQFTTTSPSITEGWITAALLDIVDTTNEQNDDLTSEDQKLWNAFSNNKATQSAYNLVAGSIYEFQKDWDAESDHPSLQNIFFLNKLSSSPGTANNSTSSTILDESFDNFNAWTEEGEADWRVGVPDEGGHPPGHPATNMVAEADNCDEECKLVLTNGLDLTLYDSATLSLYRYVDNSLDSGEYLKIDVSSNGGTSWSNVFAWNGGTDDSDDTWHKETFDLASYLNSSDFKIRAVAKASSSSEDLIIDSLKITGVAKSSSGSAIFSDDFQGTLAKWTLTSDDDNDWETSTVQRTGAPSGNKVAHSANCDKNCYMVSETIDTSDKNTDLTFYRYIATSIDNGEGLKVHVSTNGGTTWTQLVFLSADDNKDDSTWTKETIDLSAYKSNQLKIRFNAVSSSSSEHVRIDDVAVTTKGTTTSAISFNENFDDLDSWTKSGDDRWAIVSSWNEDEPTEVSTNKFASAKNCDDTCTLTLTNAIDLSSLSSANLALSRFVDSSLDDAEYLGIDVYNGSQWVTVATWSEDADENTDEWETETINVTSHLDDEFKIRINAQMNSITEDVGIDYIRIS